MKNRSIENLSITDMALISKARCCRYSIYYTEISFYGEKNNSYHSIVYITAPSQKKHKNLQSHIIYFITENFISISIILDSGVILIGVATYQNIQKQVIKYNYSLLKKKLLRIKLISKEVINSYMLSDKKNHIYSQHTAVYNKNFLKKVENAQLLNNNKFNVNIFLHVGDHQVYIAS